MIASLNNTLESKEVLIIYVFLGEFNLLWVSIISICRKQTAH